MLNISNIIINSYRSLKDSWNRSDEFIRFFGIMALAAFAATLLVFAYLYFGKAFIGFLVGIFCCYIFSLRHKFVSFLKKLSMDPDKYNQE